MREMNTEASVDEELLSENSTRKRRNIDLAEITGGDGLWQRRIFVIVFLFHVPCVFHVFSMSFLAPNLDHWCARPPEAKNLSVEVWRNIAMPLHDQHCSRYEHINLNYSLHNRIISEEATIPCQAWEYDTSFYHSTVLSQFDLVCDRKWLVSLSKSVFVAGMSVSHIVFGHMSDRIGRKSVIILSGLITIVSSIISAFSTKLLYFLIARFFIAFGAISLIYTPFVLLMEIVAPKYRNCYGLAVDMGWTLGFIILPLIAWLIRDAFWIQLAITSPCLMLLAIGWIPESPRWLLNHGKDIEAEEILLKAAKINGIQHTEEDKEVIRTLMRKGVEAYMSGGSKGNVLDLLKTPGLRKITLNVYFNWFVIVFVYYGLSINTNELAGDPFINFLLSGIAEIPAVFVAMFFARLLGKKKLLTISMVITGVACVISYVLPSNPWWLTVTVSSIGKLFVTSAFKTIIIYTNEIFPTVVRNIGVGSAFLFGRLGSITAPFMRELGSATHPIFPQIIFGVVAIASSLLIILLPDIRNISVPDTLEEAAELFRKKNVSRKEVKRKCIPVSLTEGETNNEQESIDLLVYKTTASV